MALFKKMDSRREVKFQVLLESDIFLFVGKYSTFFNENLINFTFFGEKRLLINTSAKFQIKKFVKTIPI